MSEGAWTAIGAALGALIAAATTWLSSREQSRRQIGRESRNTRRNVYTNYLSYRQELVSTAYSIVWNSTHRDEGELTLSRQEIEELKTNLHARAVEHSQAFHALSLAASDDIVERVERQAQILLNIGDRVYTALDHPSGADWRELLGQFDRLRGEADEGGGRLFRVLKNDLEK